MGLIDLVISDYRAFARLRRRSGAAALLRAALDASMHAAVLLRLSAASPGWMHWFWRNLAIAKHSIDCGRGARIGPGLYLPHPFGITISPRVSIGADVQIFQNVTIGGNLGAQGAAVVGDGVMLLPNCSVVGSVTVGEGAVVGNGALVDQDIPAGGVAYSVRATVGESPADGETAAARALRGERIGHQPPG